jgi:hypothetical protein
MSDALLSSLFESLPIPIRVCDPNELLVYENPVYAARFGAGADGAGRSLVEAPNAGRPSAFRAALAGSARELSLGMLGDHEVVAHYFPVRRGDGLVTHVGVAFLDRPAAATAHEAVRPPPIEGAEHATEIERQLRFVIDTIPQIIWSTLANGYHDFYNRRWYEYTGLRPEDTRGAGWNDPLHPDDQQRAWERWQHSLKTGEDYEIEYRFRRRDGEYRWFLGRALPLRDEEGKIVRWFGTCTDIHDQKELDRKRAEVLEQAEQNNRMKDEFLATVSHELRTPLTSILGWARLQRSNPRLRERALEVIERNAEIQAQIVEDLLDTSRIVRGTLRLYVQNVDLRGVVERAIETVRPSAEAKKITLSIQIEEALGFMVGDPSRLQQVVWNLLANAVKFTPPGGVVGLSACRACLRICIQVTDTGQGIDPAFLPRVFQPFSQAEGSSRRAAGGLGLGLAIVRHLVELHGGTVAATSEGVGKGSRFEICLPIRAVVPREPEAPERAEPVVAARAEGPPPRLDGLDVLVVDDEADARDLIAVVLAEAGASPRAVGSMTAAMAAIEERIPDLLLSDIGMPERDGFDLIRAIHARWSPPPFPAVALTAFARDVDRAECLRAGYEAHLAKPVEPEVLVRRVAASCKAAKEGRAEIG